MTGRAWIVAVSLLAASSSAASAPDPLTLDVYPRVMQAGGHASVRVRLEPNALSRTMEIAWWSADGVGGSHRKDVAGVHAAIRHELPLKYLDPGEYQVSAVITRADGTRVRRTTTLLVLPL